jgi:uncharacterized membrane-anchored protein
MNSIQQDEQKPGTHIQIEPLAIRALKVPEITIIFWIIKLLTTAMGEATSDFLLHFNPILGLVLESSGLIVALVLQLVVRRYVPWIYWLAVLMVATAGTLASDIFHGLLDFPYLVTTIIYLVVLSIIFVAWYLSEKTLSIHSITTRRRELFYWGTVMATFALGTALGDFTASLGLGFFGSIVLFAALLTIPALGYRFLSFNEVLAFWSAYILTRPLGASIADWLGRSPDTGGLGVGYGPAILALGILFIGFVGYVTFTHKEKKSQ